mmetsp:Transcript_2038/g.3485  ORF Transcript_2038/g.3485 Transcript_2038/m.3485 type:complete len:81 (-) Transcript_2038:143-385(-)
MNFSAAIITLLAGSAAAFAPAMPSAAVRTSSSIQQPTVMFAEPKEEEGLDLDLGEMFDMFDAADKGEDFDKAIKEVKKEK